VRGNGHVPALQQLHVSLQEAAESLGATKLRTIRRVVVPLMAGGVLAGFVTGFAIAAVELSATILLVSTESQVPMSDGFYLYMQSVVAGDCCWGNLAFPLAAPAADRGGRPRPDRWRALPLRSGVGGL
jgi:ABC-type maltose transport system permease subunit